MNGSPSRALWILLALLFLVPRVALIGLHHGRPYVGDELSYNQIGRNVAEGRGFAGGEGAEVRHATATRGPSYVLLVAAFERVFGGDRTPLFAFQVLLDGAALLLLLRLARRWFRSEWVAWIAGVLYAIYPPIVTSTAFVLTETLTLFTLLLWVERFFAWLEGRRTRDLVLAAVALGVCALGKPHIALFAPVACLAAIPLLRVAEAGRALVVIVLVVTATMLPWIVRNAVVFHEFIPGVSIGGMGLWFGSGAYGGRTFGSVEDPAVPDSIRQMIIGMGEIEANRWATKEAVRVIRSDPAAYARLSLAKVARLWVNLGFEDIRPSRASLLIALFNLAALVLAVVGARSAVDPVAVRVVGYGAVYWTIVNVPFFANVRYAVPFLALTFAFTAAGVVASVRALGRRRAA